MEEIINRLGNAAATYSFEAKNYPNCIVFREDLENLINKYKEQEEQIEEYKLNVKEAMHEAQENARIFRKEQEKTNKYKKIIELMLIELSNDAFYMDDNEQYCEVKHKECDGKENVPCRNCLLEYYEKKAKGE